MTSSRWISEPPEGVTVGQYYAKALRGFIRIPNADQLISELSKCMTADDVIAVLRRTEDQILLQVAKCGGEACRPPLMGEVGLRREAPGGRTEEQAAMKKKKGTIAELERERERKLAREKVSFPAHKVEDKGGP